MKYHIQVSSQLGDNYREWDSEDGLPPTEPQRHIMEMLNYEGTESVSIGFNDNEYHVWTKVES